MGISGSDTDARAAHVGWQGLWERGIEQPQSPMPNQNWSEMRTTILGRSGLQVSRIAFGTWQLGGDWGGFDTDAAVTAIRTARESGVNFFDTARAYGFGASEALADSDLADIEKIMATATPVTGPAPEAM